MIPYALLWTLLSICKQAVLKPVWVEAVGQKLSDEQSVQAVPHTDGSSDRDIPDPARPGPTVSSSAFLLLLSSHNIHKLPLPSHMKRAPY